MLNQIPTYINHPVHITILSPLYFFVMAGFELTAGILECKQLMIWLTRLYMT